MIHLKTNKQLALKADEIREDIINMLLNAGSGHTAGPLGLADIFTALYFNDLLRYDPKNPNWANRDRLVLSNGHCCPVLYATLAHAGFFSRDELKKLRKFGSILQGHPERERVPGLETTSGPLGSGLGQAAGMAYGFMMDNSKKEHVVCVCSDGEHQEGNIWESVMFAGKYKLHNLTVIIDRNNIQIDGFTENVMPLEPLAMKYQSFNWHVIEVDGNDIDQVSDAYKQAKAIFEKPTAIIAHTIPGKGVDFMENDFKWHGYDPNPKTATQDYRHALRELRTLQGRIKSGDNE